MIKQSQGKFLLMVGVIAILAAMSYYILTAPDQRNTQEKISDAVNELPNGVDKAARQLKDRTPGEKLEDAAKDTGNDIKKSTNQ